MNKVFQPKKTHCRFLAQFTKFYSTSNKSNKILNQIYTEKKITNIDILNFHSDLLQSSGNQKKNQAFNFSSTQNHLESTPSTNESIPNPDFLVDRIDSVNKKKLTKFKNN